MDATFSKPANPLSSFMRQPKIYIRLPSNGEYWPADSLAPTETGEYPVYSMTAKDELMLKIPDALLNGQAVVEVIQNCMPNIKNAWDCPNIDMDLILIAIRLATYGEQMATPIKLGDDLEMEYQVDLRTVMDNLLSSSTWDPVVPISAELTVFVKPMNYRHLTQAAIQTFETQKIIQMVNNEGLTEDDKINLFKESFSKLSGATLGTIEHSISRIESSQGSTDDPEHIRDFVSNVDKEVFNKIQLHLEDLRNKNSIKPVTVQVTEEMKEKGFTGDTLEIPLTFDPSTFFV
jgi:hypothetical protein